MPELPEVQTVVNDLQSLVGKKITGFFSNFKKAVKTEGFEKKILEKRILTVFRSGKNIVITLENYESIVVHLKMTGQLLFRKTLDKKTETKYEKHIHHTFELGKDHVMYFSDIRKFGTLELLDKETLNKKISEKGLDPFSDAYTLPNFKKLLERAKNKNLKQFLMDQTFIAGIGNIYASEIPFAIKISPLRKIGDLSSREEKVLFDSIQKILAKAIRLRGTSFSDYRDSAGKKGAFQNFLKVYKRNGQKCNTCDTIIKKIVIGQRSTFYCPSCQK